MITINKIIKKTTWLIRYPRPMEITHDQGSEFIGHELIKYLIEIKYVIEFNPRTSVNPTYNAILEQINQVLGNLCVLITLNIPM